MVISKGAFHAGIHAVSIAEILVVGTITARVLAADVKIQPLWDSQKVRNSLSEVVEGKA